MGLMDWYFGNVERLEQARASGRLNAQAEMAERYAPQVADLMGQPGMAPQQGADGLISGGISATGLMAGDMGDPNTIMQMGTGLMAIPGYQSAGQQLIGQAVGSALGRPMEVARLMEQRRYHDAQLQMQRQAAEAARSQMVGPYQDMNQYVTASGGLRDDARAELAPFRQQMSLYNTVQGVLSEKGFHGMSLADDEMFIKSYAKMLLPDEAVMTDDVARIAQSDKIQDSFLRGVAARFNIGKAMSAEERKQLWESMYRIASESAPRYEQLRSDYTDRAARMYINPADILNTAITMDARRFDLGYDPMGKRQLGVDEATSKELDEISRQQNPTLIDRAYQWYRE